jgi:hypothetical protein
MSLRTIERTHFVTNARANWFLVILRLGWFGEVGAVERAGLLGVFDRG